MTSQAVLSLKVSGARDGVRPRVTSVYHMEGMGAGKGQVEIAEKHGVVGVREGRPPEG